MSKNPHYRAGLMALSFVLLPLAELDAAFSDPRGWTAEQAAKRLHRRIAAGELAPQEIVAAGWDETGE